MQVVAFPLKLQIIKVSQHLQEIKACSPASRCRSGRLGYQASNINIAAVLGADVSRGLHKQNYNCGDYRGHLWDSLGNTSGPAIRCVALYWGYISRAAGSGDFCPSAVPQGREGQSSVSRHQAKALLGVTCSTSVISFLGKLWVCSSCRQCSHWHPKGLGFHSELSSLLRACSGVVRSLGFGCSKEMRC